MQKFTIEFKWAILLTILAMLWSVLERQMGFHSEQVAKHMLYNIIFSFLVIPVYFLAIRDKKQNYFKNTITWAQGFVSGAIVSVIMAVLSPLVTLFTYNVVSPNYFDLAISSAIQKGVALQTAQMYFNLESYMLQNAFTTLSTGLVLSALIALLLKNK